MAHGGARPGSGRKPRAVERKIKQDKNNATFDEKAVEALPDLFEALKELAQGIKIATYTQQRKVKTTQRYDDKGDVVYVYTVPPDKDCLRYLVDRAAGKAAVKPVEAAETELILEIAMPAPIVEDDDGIMV